MADSNGSMARGERQERSADGHGRETSPVKHIPMEEERSSKSHVFCATELGHALVAGFLVLLLGKDLSPERNERSPEGNEPLHDGGEQTFLWWLG